MMEDKKENMETTAGSVEKVKKCKQKEKTFSRDEVNKIVNAETNKALKKYKEQVEAEKTQIEKLARIKNDERLQYQLEKERAEKQEALAELNAYRLKEKAVKMASEKSIERSLLDLIDFKTVTVETLNDNIDNLSNVFNKAVEKTINEKFKEDVPIAKMIN